MVVRKHRRDDLQRCGDTLVVLELEIYSYGFDGRNVPRLSVESKNVQTDNWCAYEQIEMLKPCSARRLLRKSSVSTFNC